MLALLFGRPDTEFYLRQIVRHTGAGTGAVQRELARLAAAGLVGRVRDGRQVYFSADPSSPVFAELRGLLAKTAGIADVLRSALAPLAAKDSVAAAFIYGSVAAGRHTSESDVDLMVVGDARLSDLVPLLSPAEEQLGREVNPTIYPAKELRAALREPGHFVARVLEGPRIMLLGTDDDIATVAGERLADASRDEPLRGRTPARRRRPRSS